MEALQELKKELIETISGMEDYDLLLTLKEDVALYQKQTMDAPYAFPGATDEEREELIRLDKGEEIDESDCVSQEEYDKLVQQWLTK